MLKKVFYSAALSITVIMIAVLVSLPTPIEKITPNHKSAQSLLIKNALVFNGENKLLNLDIEIRDGLIKNIGTDLTPSSSTASAATTNASTTNASEIIDARGKTLIPGFIDAHTHSFANALSSALNFGVTTHVDMFTYPSALPSEKEKRTSVSQASEADLYSAGMLATVDGGHGTQFGLKIETINSPDQAKQWVERRVNEGSDFIKIVYMPYSNYFKSIDRATAAAIIEASHDLNLQVLAHVSSQRAAQELLEDGIDGLVHIFTDEKVSDEFIKLAKYKNVFVIPTLSVIASAANENLGTKLANNPLIKPYLKPNQYQQLQSNYGNRKLPGFELSIAIHNVQKLHQNGITILAGSDAANPGTTYGATVHQELQLLTRAGLTPNEALKAATIEVAEQFNLMDRGRIKIGMKADLILLNSNPLTDITATLDIESIYKNGQALKRQISSQHSASSNAPENISSPNLSDFTTSLDSPAGFHWAKTDDTLAGGKSNASISLNETFLSVDATVNPGFMFPWAGAGAFTQQAVNVSPYTRLQFKVRGTKGAYRVMVFSGAQTGAPPSQGFDATNAWQTISLELKNFKGLDANNFFGVAVVAGPTQGEFKYQLDDVKLLP